MEFPSLKDLRKCMKLFHQLFFKDQKWDLLPLMSVDERKEYMLECIDDMCTIDYVMLHKKKELEELKARIDAGDMSAKAEYDDYMMENAFNSLVFNPGMATNIIWENAFTRKPNSDTAFSDKQQYDSLSDGEKVQVDFAMELFSVLYGLKGGYPVSFDRFMPGVNSCNLNLDNPNDLHKQINFDHPDMKQFLATTPYRNVAAMLTHTVMRMFFDAFKQLFVGGVLDNDKAAEVADLFVQEGKAYELFENNVLTNQQYILRARSIFSLWVNEYDLYGMLHELDSKVKGGGEYA